MNAARSVSILLIAATTLCAAGCKSSGTTQERTGANNAAGASQLPAPAKALEPLAFMTGKWMYPTPNGRLLNREHWMSPSGTSMVGAFQQMKLAGGVAFYEYSAITAEPREKDGPVVVTLYHRHLHTKLAIDERRKDVDVFTLESTGPNSATFAPAVDIPGGIKNMTYRLDGPDTLVQEINFKPDSKEKSFSTAYRREK